VNTYVQAVTDDNRKAQTEFEKRFSEVFRRRCFG